jgi:hypothetical protein
MLLASALSGKPSHLHRTSSLLLLSSRLPSVWKCFQTEDFGRPPLPVLPAAALVVPEPPPGVRTFAPTEPSRSCCGSCTPGCSYSATCWRMGQHGGHVWALEGLFPRSPARCPRMLESCDGGSGESLVVANSSNNQAYLADQ